MIAASKQPNFIRFARVAAVIASDPALQRELGTKTETVYKPDGSKEEFPKEVIEITEHIHGNGQDAHTINRSEIMRAATKLLVLKEPLVSAAPARADDQPVKVKKAKVKRVKKAVAKKAAPVAEKPKVESTVEKPKEKPKVKKPKAQKLKPAEKPKTEEKPVEKPPTEKEEKPQTVEIASPPLQALKSPLPFAVGCAVFTNLVAASQLMEIHDRSPEGIDLRERLDNIISDVQKQTDLSNSAKESQSKLRV
jgi:hypothetical protein